MATPAASVVEGKKACSGCCVVKSLDDFRKHPTGLGGRRSKCRECEAQRVAVWKQTNRERLQAQKRRYHAKHADRLNGAKRAQRDDAVRARERAWWHANPEKGRAANHRRRVQAPRTDPAIMARIAELLTQPCTYCGSLAKIEIDHIVPLSRGGAHKPDNLAAACQRCNRSKKDRLLSEWRAG